MLVEPRPKSPAVLERMSTWTITRHVGRHLRTRRFAAANALDTEPFAPVLCCSSEARPVLRLRDILAAVCPPHSHESRSKVQRDVSRHCCRDGDPYQRMLGRRRRTYFRMTRSPDPGPVHPRPRPCPTIVHEPQHALVRHPGALRQAGPHATSCGSSRVDSGRLRDAAPSLFNDNTAASYSSSDRYSDVINRCPHP